MVGEVIFMTDIRLCFKKGDRVTIKKGSVVAQDFKFYCWPDIKNNVNTIFEVCDYLTDSNRVWLEAKGYGIPDGENYGSGKILVSDEYLKLKENLT